MQNRSTTERTGSMVMTITMAVVFLWSGAALAVPAAVPYIGFLSDGDGPFDGTVTVSVEMFDQADGDVSLWGPVEFTEVVVESGVFTVVLGAPTGPELDTLVVPAEGAWLEFTIDETLLEPRQEMLSVPFALWAESADACGEAESLSGDEGAVTASDLAAKNHNHDSVYVNEGQGESVTAVMLAPGAVTGAKVDDGSLTVDDFGDSGCGDGQVIKWVTGSGVWTCANDLGGGGAEYTAGTGLLLAGTEFSVVAATIEGWATGVCYDTPTELSGALSGWDQDGSDDLTTDTVFAGDVSGTHDSLVIAGGAVTEGKLAGDAVTSDKIEDGAIALSDIGQNGCQEGEAMRWSGSSWACTPVYSQGQVDANFALIAALTDAVGRLDAAEANIEAMQGTISAQAATIAELEDEMSCPSDMVQMGDFCIDRYETSLWSRKDGEPVECEELQAAVDEADAAGWTAEQLYSGYKAADCGVGALAMCNYQQYGSEPGCTNNETCDDYPDGFPNNGNWTVPVYACAIEGVGPSRSLTWFQAQQACVLSGKRLCFDSEWQAAAAGTPDPHTTDPGGDWESCNIWPNSKPGERDWATDNQSVKTQSEAACVSNHGAYDMVGNLWEWTADWWGQGGNADDGNQPDAGVFHGDGYWNVDNAQYNGVYDEGNPVFPASARRGGHWNAGSEAGVFALALGHGPAHWGNDSGARCCRRK